jgi:DNA-binding GntR family transcriptional regulator
LDVQELHDVFEARILLECQSARIAAQRADAQDISKLRDMIKEYQTVGETRDFRQLFRIDQAFHRAVAVATKNRLLEQQVTVLSNNAARFWFVGIARLDRKSLVKTIQSHIDVVNAISKRDSAAAELAMQKCVGDFPGFVDHFVKNSQIYGRGR